MNDSITICFYGSSDNDLKLNHDNEINLIINQIFQLEFRNIKIITGGYGGIMNSIAHKFSIERAKYNNKTIELIGITCDAYDFEDIDKEGYEESNVLSQYNETIIQAADFSDRIQSMIELSDLFIVLPGRQGSLVELLLTYESYSYSKNILNDKKAKLFVHQYWKKLLNNTTFFRHFKANILEYYTADTISNLVSLLNIDPITSNNNEVLEEDVPIGDYISSKFLSLKNNINRAILGRLYDNNMSLDRIGINNEAPMLGLDFGWFVKGTAEDNDGGFYTYSTKAYTNYTKEFFGKNNSIMLHNNEKEFGFRETILNGLFHANETLGFDNKNLIPKKDNNLDDGDFNKLRDFFNNKEYGQTLIWRGFKVTQNNFTKWEKDNKVNEIIFSVFLLLNHKISTRKKEKIRQLIEDFLLTVSSTKAGELFQVQEDKIIKQATRAAISQVMARNMSHNIGSHVMNKLTGDLNEYDIYSTESYASDEMKILYKDKFENAIKNGISEALLKNEILLDQISAFNNYVKCRMDYLSDVTFGTPLMQTNKKVYGEIFKGLDKVRLLLNNISGLNKFRFEIKFVRTDYKCNNETGERIPITSPLDANNDLPIAMPNDVLGCHAFYNIIENVIRNTAKHNQKKEESSTTIFTVNIHTIIPINEKDIKKASDDKKIDVKETLDLLNTMYMVEIYDNLPVELRVTDKERLEYIKQVDSELKPEDIQPIHWLIYQQNKKINTSVLQENHALRTHSLGIVEMEASAAYLRKMEITDFNGDDFDVDYKSNRRLTKSLKFPFVKAFKKPIPDKNIESLGYRFFVHKPQEILLVGDFEIVKNEAVVKKLLQDGVWIKKDKDFEDELTAGKVYNHQFVIFKDNDTLNSINKYKTALPVRTLFLDENKLKELNKILEEYIDFKVLEEYLWTWWGDIIDLPENCTNLIFNANPNPFNPNTYNACISDHAPTPGHMNHVRYNFNVIFNADSICKYNYFECLSSNTQKSLPGFTGSLVDWFPILNTSNIEKCQMKESVLSKILVIDERIQRESSKHKEIGGVKYSLINSMTNIYLPKMDGLTEVISTIEPSNIELDLGADNFDDEFKDLLKKYFKETIQKFNPKLDFILIHYSILERYFNSKEEDIRHFINKYGLEYNLVFTSGRGKPDLLKDEEIKNKIRFVNLSAILNVFIDNRSKYLINKLLNSSRK